MLYNGKMSIEYAQDQMKLDRTWEVIKKTDLFDELYNLLKGEKMCSYSQFKKMHVAKHVSMWM